MRFGNRRPFTAVRMSREWIPADAADSCDWFPCEVIEVNESEDDSRSVSCRIRFQNGEEWEIQGIYQWNRPNWRFLT
ncbi:hypothetical protein [Microcystis sp. M061S2]|uniref:hypothetical protein n=1 Tax=Microcystis sp. M061S2 TaxID=2771171 RepID=UPI002585B045|nr:hypothetical protein [Microcystis sp. M061S2]